MEDRINAVIQCLEDLMPHPLPAADMGDEDCVEVLHPVGQIRAARCAIDAFYVARDGK